MSVTTTGSNDLVWNREALPPGQARRRRLHHGKRRLHTALSTLARMDRIVHSDARHRDVAFRRDSRRANARFGHR